MAQGSASRADLKISKGVICKIIDDEYMPVDSNGHVADIGMEPSISRMNLGRYYEPYINSASDKVHAAICSILGVKPFKPTTLAMNDQVMQAWGLYTEYLQVVNPDATLDCNDANVICETLEHVVLKNIYTWIPINHPRRLRDVVKIIMSDNRFRPYIGPVTMKMPSGKVITTKSKVLIGDLYVLLLQQTGNDWSATSSGKTQIHGLLASTSRSTKYTTPFKDQGTRIYGDSELRIIASYCGGKVAAHLHNINNNPTLHRVNCDNILNAPKPTRIKDVCIGTDITISGNAPVNLSRHLLECYGLELVYQPYNAKVASTQTPSKDIANDDLKEL